MPSWNRPWRFRFKEILQNSDPGSQKHRTPALGATRPEPEKGSGCLVQQVWMALGRQPSLLTALPLCPLSWNLTKISGIMLIAYNQCRINSNSIDFELELPPYPTPVFLADELRICRPGRLGVGIYPLCQGVSTAYSSLTCFFPFPCQDLKKEVSNTFLKRGF